MKIEHVGMLIAGIICFSVLGKVGIMWFFCFLLYLGHDLYNHYKFVKTKQNEVGE